MFTIKKSFVLPVLILMLGVLPGCGTTNTSDITNDSSDSGVVVGTIESLLGTNKSQKCTWKGTDGETGVVYTDSEKSRVEISDVSNGKILMVNDGEWQYSWVEGEKEGSKMNLKDFEEMGKEYEDVGGEEVDVEYTEEEFDFKEEEGEYSCENWKADSSYFVPAPDVDYIDLAEQFKAFDEVMGNLESPEFQADMRALCDLLPPSEKEECLKDFE